jgi:hypothetical protein
MKNKKGFYWGTTTVYIPSTNERVEVKALILRDSGLCINQYDPLAPKGKFVSVTHIATGYRLSSAFFSARSARWFCEAISGLMDWHTIKKPEDTRNFPRIGEEVKAIRDLVVVHKDNWKTALVVWKLTNGREML